jgi:hypothetical protein
MMAVATIVVCMQLNRARKNRRVNRLIITLQLIESANTSCACVAARAALLTLRQKMRAQDRQSHVDSQHNWH